MSISLLSTVLLSLLIAPIALANYKPPKKATTPKTTTITGSRGESCEGNSKTGLTPLVPYTHVGQTIATHPTFAWFVADSKSYSLEFRLFKDEQSPDIYRTTLKSKAGIMQISLPNDQPQLAVGERYIWQIVMICDPAPPIKAIVAEAEIEVVAPPEELTAQLAAASDEQATVNYYAAAGLWYSALAAALKLAPTPNNQSPLTTLLNDLATSEAENLKEWSDRLRAINQSKNAQPLLR